MKTYLIVVLFAIQLADVDIFVKAGYDTDPAPTYLSRGDRSRSAYEMTAPRQATSMSRDRNREMPTSRPASSMALNREERSRDPYAPPPQRPATSLNREDRNRNDFEIPQRPASAMSRSRSGATYTMNRAERDRSSAFDIGPRSSSPFQTASPADLYANPPRSAPASAFFDPLAPSQVEATPRQPLFGALPQSSQFSSPTATRPPLDSRDTSPPADSLLFSTGAAQPPAVSTEPTGTAQATPKAEGHPKKQRAPPPPPIITDHRSGPVTVGNMLGIELEPAPKSAPQAETLINLLDEPHQQQPHHPPPAALSKEVHSDLLFLDANSFSPTTQHATTPTTPGGDVFDLLATPGPQNAQKPIQSHTSHGGNAFDLLATQGPQKGKSPIQPHTSHGGDQFDLLGLDIPEPAVNNAAAPLSPAMADLAFLDDHFPANSPNPPNPPNPHKVDAEAPLIDLDDEPAKIPSLPGVPSAHPHAVPVHPSTSAPHHTAPGDSKQPHSGAAKHEPKPDRTATPPPPEKAPSAMEQLTKDMISEIDKKDKEEEETPDEDNEEEEFVSFQKRNRDTDGQKLEIEVTKVDEFRKSIKEEIAAIWADAISADMKVDIRKHNLELQKKYDKWAAIVARIHANKGHVLNLTIKPNEATNYKTREHYHFLLDVMSAFSQLENEIYYVFELYVFFLDTSREVYFEFYRKIEELAQHSEDPDLHIFIHEFKTRTMGLGGMMQKLRLYRHHFKINDFESDRDIVSLPDAIANEYSHLAYKVAWVYKNMKDFRFSPETNIELVDMHDVHRLTREKDKPIRHVNANVKYRQDMTTNKLSGLLTIKEFDEYIELVRAHSVMNLEIKQIHERKEADSKAHADYIERNKDKAEGEREAAPDYIPFSYYTAMFNRINEKHGNEDHLTEDCMMILLEDDFAYIKDLVIHRMQPDEESTYRLKVPIIFHKMLHRNKFLMKAKRTKIEDLIDKVDKTPDEIIEVRFHEYRRKIEEPADTFLRLTIEKSTDDRSKKRNFFLCGNLYGHFSWYFTDHLETRKGQTKIYDISERQPEFMSKVPALVAQIKLNVRIAKLVDQTKKNVLKSKFDVKKLEKPEVLRVMIEIEQELTEVFQELSDHQNANSFHLNRVFYDELEHVDNTVNGFETIKRLEQFLKAEQTSSDGYNEIRLKANEEKKRKADEAAKEDAKANGGKPAELLGEDTATPTQPSATKETEKRPSTPSSRYSPLAPTAAKTVTQVQQVSATDGRRTSRSRS